MSLFDVLFQRGSIPGATWLSLVALIATVVAKPAHGAEADEIGIAPIEVGRLEPTVLFRYSRSMRFVSI